MKPIYRTPGRDLEERLNRDYGPGTSYYEDFCRLIREGISNNEGWVATEDIDGPKYRRSKISPPTINNRLLSFRVKTKRVMNSPSSIKK